jgi:hypothetical protein
MYFVVFCLLCLPVFPGVCLCVHVCTHTHIHMRAYVWSQCTHVPTARLFGSHVVCTNHAH